MPFELPTMCFSITTSGGLDFTPPPLLYSIGILIALPLPPSERASTIQEVADNNTSLPQEEPLIANQCQHIACSDSPFKCCCDLIGAGKTKSFRDVEGRDRRSVANLLNRCQFSGFGFGGRPIRSLSRRAPDGFRWFF